MKKLIALLALILMAGAAQADEVYTYTGTAFNVFDGLKCNTCLISGTFTVPDLLPAADALNQQPITDITDFSFTDGLITISAATATSIHFTAGVDASGAIITWVIDLFDGKGDRLFTDYSGSAAESEDFSSHKHKNAWEQGLPGSWTMHDPPSATPEPLSIFLILGSIVAFAAYKLLLCGWSGPRNI